MHRFVALLTLPLVLGSCFMGQTTLDHPLAADAIAQLQVGQSTQEDVSRLLGAPNQVVELGDKSAWLFSYQNTKQMGLWLLLYGSYGQDTQSDRCWVFFDENGVLRNIGVSLDASQSSYHLSGS